MEIIREIIKDNVYLDIRQLKKKLFEDKERKIILDKESKKLNIGVTEYLYLLKEDIQIPLCTVCSKERQIFKSFLEGYSGYCSRFCSDKCPLRKERRKQTNINKFGTPDFQREKIKKVLLQKYGVDNPTKNKEIAKKAVEKRRETLLKETGFDNPFKNPDVRKHLQKKQDENRQEIVDKMKQVFFKKYGVDNPAKNLMIKEKILRESQKGLCRKYNVDSVFEAYQLINWNKKKDRFEILKKKYKDIYNISILSNVEETKFVSFFSSSFSFHCNNCNSNYIGPLTTTSEYNISRCLECFPLKETKAERFLQEFIGKNTIYQVLRNNRNIVSNKELDLYVPNLNLAIEYNGLMFHSIGKSSYSMFNNSNLENDLKKYHFEKTQLCQEKGIQLLHIFENEWLSSIKREIWLSILSIKLGIVKNKYFARNLIINQVDSKTLKTFLTENHLQGYVPSKISLGLYTKEGKLVQVVTFGRSRFDKKYTYELYRLSTQKNTIVVGGVSKLFSFFKHNILKKGESIVTYADRRYSQGDVYRRLGFLFVNYTTPNYYYFKDGTLNLENRIKFQKHNLHKILRIYDKNLTETENMYNNNYRKIYDSGNLIFSYIKT